MMNNFKEILDLIHGIREDSSVVAAQLWSEGIINTIEE